MKTFKKSLAIILSVVMMLGMCGVAFAQSEWSELPTEDSEAMEVGAYWFDKAGFVDLMMSQLTPEDEDYNMMLEAYEGATFYINPEGTTLRFIIAGNPTEIEIADDFTFSRFLHQHGVDPNEGFLPLPLEDSEELEDGDYWFDLAAFAELASGPDDTPDEIYEEYAAFDWFISEDGDTIRIVYPWGATDLSRYSEGGSVYFTFLHQHGVDPYEGYILLPMSDSDDLEDGDYYFDLLSFVRMSAGDEVPEEELPAMLAEYEELITFYLSEDGETLLMVYSGFNQEFTRDDDGSIYFSFVKQHGVDPLEGFVPVAYDAADIPEGGWIFLVEDYLVWYGESLVGEINYETEEPYTEEEIAAEVAENRENILASEIMVNEEKNQFAIIEMGIPMIMSMGSEFAEEIAAFLHLAFLHSEEATCTEAGYTDALVIEQDGDITILTEGEPEAATGHEYEASWEWAEDGSKATLTLTCKKCEDTVVLVAEGEAIDVNKTEATETEDGLAVYTASFTEGEETYTNSFEIVLPKTGTDDPGDPGTEPSTEPSTEPAGSDEGKCKWCGESHDGFWGKIVGFFHRILYFFAHLFGKR